MKSTPLVITRALSLRLPRGSRASGPNIPPNMLERLRDGEARAWAHSTLAGHLWEAGERASRAIALASAHNSCENPPPL